MLTLLIFVIVLSVLVFVHELGHFIVAKRAGMRVDEFGFGFPPRIWGIRRGETTYSINWIPFGGFVKIHGEDDTAHVEPRSFASKPLWQRAAVLVAGVAMNVVLAFVLLTIVHSVGVRTVIERRSQALDATIEIAAVAPDSPAAAAGLQEADEVLSYREGDSLIRPETVKNLQEYITAHKGDEVLLEIRHKGVTSEKRMVPRVNPPPGQGALGVSLLMTGTLQMNFSGAVKPSVYETGAMIKQTVGGYATAIKSIFHTSATPVELTGPIGIAVYTGKIARMGIVYLLQFMALISVNLAVLNIIPFPALDGGRLLFVLIEAVFRKPLPRKIEQAVNALGFALLLLLMIYVTTKDIIKFLPHAF